MTEPLDPTSAAASQPPADTEPTGTAPDGAAPAGDTPAPPVKAARKRAPRKRAPAKKAAAALEVETAAAAAAGSEAPDAAPAAGGAPPLTPVDQPAEPAAPRPAGEVSPGEASAAAEQAPVTSPAAGAAPGAADDVTGDDETGDDEKEEEDDDAPRAAVLFQPPTTPRRRRRGASAPAGPPVHQDAPADVPVTTTAAPPAVTFGAPDLDAVTPAPAPRFDAPSADAAPAATPDDTTTGDTTTGNASSDDSGRDAHGDADSDADDESAGRRRRRGRRGRGRRTGADDDTAGGEDATGDRTGDEPAAGRDGPDAADHDTDTTGDDRSVTEADGPDGPDNTDDTDDTDPEGGSDTDSDSDGDGPAGSSRRRRRRRRRGGGGSDADADADSTEGGDGGDPPRTVVHVREPRDGGGREGGGRDGGGRDGGKDNGGRDGGKDGGSGRRRRGERSTEADDDGVRGVRGSTRLEAKRQRRRDGRDNGRKRAPIISEAEFLARREAVQRVMAIRQVGDRTQIGVLEDDVLVEHYVTRASATSYVGNVYLGRVQNVLPSMEAAFVDIGKGRNGVLYAGEVNWDAAGLDGKSRSIEQALHSGDSVLVQVTKDPVGHKGARLTSQVSLPGRYLVYVPGGGMTGISRKLPDTERSRLKAILKKVVPEDGGVIVRTAAEGASEEDLARDVQRLVAQWESIQARTAKKGSAPELVHGEPDLAIRVVRDLFNEDVTSLVVQGEDAYAEVSGYLADMAPELIDRLSRYTGTGDVFHDLRVDEQLAKALDRKVWLPSGGSLVIDRTEAMTVVDVNTGKYIGSGGNLEETVTRNNLEAAEEIVRQLRLRDVGGIIVVDFIDMVLESNRDLVLRRLTECLGRDRTKHQVAEVTSLGLVQMTRKRVGEGLLEAFSTPCEHCHGRGVMVSSEPVDQKSGNGNGNGSGNGNGGDDDGGGEKTSGRRRRGKSGAGAAPEPEPEAKVTPVDEAKRKAAAEAMAAMARTAAGETGPVGDLAREVGRDVLADTVEDAVTDIPAAAGADDGASPRVDGPADPAESVDAADTGTADLDDVTEERAVAEAAAGPVDAPADDAGGAAEPAVADPGVVDPTLVDPAEGDPTPPAKKAAPRRRRAARRPAGAPPADPSPAGE